MEIQNKKKIIEDLKTFSRHLKLYKARQLKLQNKELKENQQKNLLALLEKLQNEHGRLKDIIASYGGVSYIPVPFLGMNYEVFNHVLSSTDVGFRGYEALDAAIHLTNVTRGELEAEVMNDSSYDELDLEKFLDKLNKYLDYVQKIYQGSATRTQRQEGGALRRELIEDSGKNKFLISELTGLSTTLVNLKNSNIKADRWLYAFTNNFKQQNIDTLRSCADITRQAVGKLKDDIKNGLRDRLGNLIQKPENINGYDLNISNILDRFSIFANALKDRHSTREALIISDEYDVQYLLYALLKLQFDDVRREEWTPSYAGGSARIDFIIKEKKTIIEAKMTRDALRDKQIGDELIIDIARYKSYPDCKMLICFIYDPLRLIRNPIGLENDLKKLATDQLNLKIFVRF